MRSGFFGVVFNAIVRRTESEGNAMAPVEGFFLPAASIKAQKIMKGIRNGTSLIPEYISRKQSMRHGND